MKYAELLSGWGFDATRLRFTLRTALACCIAVLASWLLGLEHPHWAGMTVWAASLPIRDHMVEKVFSGTVRDSMVNAFAVLLAPLTAFVAFRLIYPSTAKSRMNTSSA